jgi:hypothetical protein
LPFALAGGAAALIFLAGVLPPRRAGLTRTDVPREAMIVVLLLATGLIVVGDLSSAAHLTDAMVLISVTCVNPALMWLAVRRTRRAACSRVFGTSPSQAPAV